jgi:hypothetical protein
MRALDARVAEYRLEHRNGFGGTVDGSHSGLWSLWSVVDAMRESSEGERFVSCDAEANLVSELWSLSFHVELNRERSLERCLGRIV